MNLQKLFEVQKVLRDRINYNEPDRFNKLILALLVELGECANEQRSWKFWSKNQQPRIKAVRNVAMNEEDKEYYNPLLEEYVDCLHFILELGLEMDIRPTLREIVPEQSVEDSFLTVMEFALQFDLTPDKQEYSLLFSRFVELGGLLGFTWEQVEEAYLEKNAENHARQDRGY